jgi:hypothetical protein
LQANTFRKLETWIEHELAQEGLSMLCCISRANPKIVPATTARILVGAPEDARAAVKKKSDNNVVPEALQAKWMDYSDIKARPGL